MRFAIMVYVYTTVGGELAYGHRRSHRIFFIAQVPHHRDMKIPFVRITLSHRLGRLVNNREFIALLWRQRIGDQVMQAHQSVRQMDGLQGCIRVAVYETVSIGSGNGHDQRTPGKSIGELLDGLCTAPGV